MTLPRQNSAWVDGDGRPTRDLYNWARSVSFPTESPSFPTEIGELDNVRISDIQDGDTLAWDNTVGSWINSASSIESVTAALAADVELTTTGTWYSGPHIDLPAGTWLVTATATMTRSATTATIWVSRITDSVTSYASTQSYSPSSIGSGVSHSLNAIITLASATTIRIEATTNAGATACQLKAATSVSGSGNNATIISAVRLA